MASIQDTSPLTKVLGPALEGGCLYTVTSKSGLDTGYNSYHSQPVAIVRGARMSVESFLKAFVESGFAPRAGTAIERVEG